MEKKIRAYIEQFHMIKPHDRIIVGVSGGADSICLLFLLHQLSQEMSFELAVVHINHMIRETAKRDEEYVKEFCKQRDIECFVERILVKELADKEKLTIEEAGRKARFEAFDKWKNKWKADKIALAHHRNDQTETVLFHLSRGCGIDGLCGIRPVRDEIIHPLLCFTRTEIEAFLKEKGLSYMTDETNAETVYRRNILRHEIIPAFEEKICADTGEHIAKTAEICMEAADFLKEETDKLFCRTVTASKQYKDGFCINMKLFESHPYLQKSVIHEVIAKTVKSRKDIAYVHIEAVRSLSKKQVGRSVNLPYCAVAKREYDGILVYIKPDKEQTSLEEALDLTMLLKNSGESLETVVFGKYSLEAKIFEYDGETPISQNKYTKWFDYDKINGCLKVRTRQSGDYFTIQENKHQTLKAYMVNEKIPAKIRDTIPVIAEGSHILWMTGYRISSFYKVTEETKRILEITIRGGEDDGRNS